ARVAQQLEPCQIVVRDGTLYWTNLGGSVMRMPATGGTPTVLATRQGTPAGIAVDDVAVYWTAVGARQVRSLPLADEAPISTLAVDQDGPITIRARGGFVFWANAQGGDGRIIQAPAGGGAPVVLATGSFPYGVAVDDAYVYWTEERGVRRVPIGGGPSTALATDDGLPSDIAVDAANVYWIDSSPNGSVMKLAK